MVSTDGKRCWEVLMVSTDSFVTDACHELQLLAALQGQLPCLTPEGKIIMASPHSLANAPDGNGGVYLALAK